MLSAGVVLVLVLATLIAYAGVLNNGFTSFDDPQYITSNPQVRAGLTAESVRWAFTHAYSDNWHPLTWLSHMVDVSSFGLDPRGHHAMSVVLHVINGVLLFALLLRLTARRIPSALCAAFFLLHPLRVESVAWAAERKDVLSGLFFFLTLLAYAHYVERKSKRRYAIALAAFALGLLAKPMLVSLPLVLLSLDRWPLERTGTFPPERHYWIEKLPFFALSILSACVTLWAQSIGGTVKSLEFISPLDRISNAATSVWIYFAQTLWPRDLAFFYPHPALVDDGAFLGLTARGVVGVLALIGVTWLVLRRADREPWWCVGWFWMLATIAPVIGIVQVGAQAHADRYTYLPFVGVGIALVFGVGRLLRQSPDPAQTDTGIAGTTVERGFAAAAIAAVGIYGFMSADQVAVWRSSERLYQHALDVTDNNYIAAFNLGALASSAGDHARAISYYSAALGMRPNYGAAHSNVGVAFDRAGDLDRAAHHYREALRLEPRLARTAINLGSLHRARGELEAARTQYQRALEARPDLALPHEVLGELEMELGKFEAALSRFEAAVAIAPRRADLRARLAEALADLGNEARAIGQYEAALERDPELLVAINALARLLATAADPTLRDPQRALEWAKQASHATHGQNPTFLMTLALAHAAAGEHDEARRQRDRAIGFAKPAEREALRTVFDRHGFRGHDTKTASEGDAAS
ncbi:MAG: tetratricopeptide repeat protein [Myxococcota bacterium]|jgi:tetratricopeptide (TPR) repeat protein|nr:tetratricopeptide repeat protein [Myxococcota bacterium]